MNNILIIHPNWLGDVLFSTPAVRALRKKFPNSRIVCLVPSRLKELLENNPHVNEVLCYDPAPLVFSVLGSMPLISKIKKSGFDTAIFLHASKTKVFLAVLGGIKRRIGFGSLQTRGLLTEIYADPGAAVHRTDVFLRLLENLGIPSDGRVPDFYPKEGSEAALDGLLEDFKFTRGEPYAVVHAGGNWDLKRWPAGHFVEWIRLFRKASGSRVFLCGTKGEESLSREILGRLNDDGVVSLCGRTSIDTLAILLRNARFLLSNDSGPIHLAASQGTRIVGLFGPTSEEITGPVSKGPSKLLRLKVGCEVPCYFKACDTRICLDWLAPEEVFRTTLEIMKP